MRAERQIEVERDALAADVERLQGQIDDLTKQAETLLKMKFSDVLSQPLPEELAQTGLESLRQRYLSAQMNVDQLSAELGPRHPRFLAAKAAADEARAAVAKALSGVVADLNRQKARAAKDLDGVKPKLEVLQKRSVPEPVTRRLELEKNVENARKIYLDRLREANISQASTIKAELTTTATAANASVIGMPHWVYAILGALAGLCLGGACLPSRRPSHSVEGTGSPAMYPVVADAGTIHETHAVEPQPEVAAALLQPRFRCSPTERRSPVCRPCVNWRRLSWIWMRRRPAKIRFACRISRITTVQISTRCKIAPSIMLTAASAAPRLRSLKLSQPMTIAPWPG